MDLLAIIAALLVALLHLGFLILEMFFWTKPLGRQVFALSEQRARDSATLAANQGLYNGFLAAGLVWGAMLGEAGTSVLVFFLCCVIVAGVFGGFTAKRSILWVQAAPAAVALLLVWLR